MQFSKVLKCKLKIYLKNSSKIHSNSLANSKKKNSFLLLNYSLSNLKSKFKLLRSRFFEMYKKIQLKTIRKFKCVLFKKEREREKEIVN